jgi:small subunit ribosomal protein S9
MADDATPQDEQVDEAPAVEETPEAPAAEADEATEVAAAEVEEPVAEAGAEEPAAEEPAVEEPAAEAPAAAEPAPAAEAPAAEAEEDEEDDEEPTPRVKPAIPGMDLQPDIVPEGVDPLAREEAEEEEAARAAAEAEEELLDQPVTATIDLGASARYTATGKRKTAIARVILKPGTGAYTINGKTLDEFFPRATLQKTIRQPLEAVGYEERMDVVATMTGGGVSAQAGALRHGISRALLEADPNLRGELKRRGYLTRDSRAKERKKAGLKKARKRPQFSKR